MLKYNTTALSYSIMGVFDFWKKKGPITDNHSHSQENEYDEGMILEAMNNNNSVEIIPPLKNLPEIPEEVFIEKEPPKNNKPMSPQEAPKTANDINVLYDYLEQNFEKQGYEDALMNPDMHNMNENLENIKVSLFIVISKVKTYYTNHIKTIEFHIESRKRNGMIDTVEELVSLKDNASQELTTVLDIEADTHKNQGLSQNLFMSYKKGFRNGLAAISFDTVLRRKI